MGRSWGDSIVHRHGDTYRQQLDTFAVTPVYNSLSGSKGGRGGGVQLCCSFITSKPQRCYDDWLIGSVAPPHVAFFFFWLAASRVLLIAAVRLTLNVDTQPN